MAAPDTKRFAGTAVSDVNGDATFDLSAAAFAVVPVVSLALQTSVYPIPKYEIKTLSLTSCTVSVLKSNVLEVVPGGLHILAASVPVAGVTVHLAAVDPGAHT